MNSRMSRYDTSNSTNSSRLEKNKKLYEEITDLDVDYIDLKDSNVLEIESQDLSKMSRSNYQKMKEYETIIPPVYEEEALEEVPLRKSRVYDIDEILKKAKEEAKTEEQKKRLINTEYNILTKLDINEIEHKDLKQEEIKELIEKTYPKEEIDDNVDLFHDLVDANEDEKEVEEIINQEVENVVENDEVQEDASALDVKDEKEEEEKEDIEKKETEDSDVYTTTTTEILERSNGSKKLITFIIIIVVLLVAMGLYLFLKYFGTL